MLSNRAVEGGVEILALPGEAGLLAVPQIDLQESTDACLSRLAAIAEEIEDEGVEVDYKVVSGVPFLEISRYAGEQDPDMIVMGSRGRSGLGHLLIGSVADDPATWIPRALVRSSG